jgi:hypothetical protein
LGNRENPRAGAHGNWDDINNARDWPRINFRRVRQAHEKVVPTFSANPARRILWDRLRLRLRDLSPFILIPRTTVRTAARARTDFKGRAKK